MGKNNRRVMKAYKLIKKYPSLPESIKEGDVVIKVPGEESEIYGYFNPKTGTYNNAGASYNTNEVENNPEFWEYVSLKCVVIFQNEPHIIIEYGKDILVWRCRANTKNIISYSERYVRKYFEKNSDMYFWIAEELKKFEENT